MFDENAYFFINDVYTLHGEGRISSSAIDAAMRIDWRMIRGSSIKSIQVSKRKVKLTHSERYALYKAKMDQMQLDVLQRAAANPEDFLLNSYTHVLILSEQFADDSFLDVQGVPQYKGDPWVKTEIDKLCEDWEKKLCF